MADDVRDLSSVPAPSARRTSRAATFLRYVIAIVALVALVGGLVAIKAKQIGQLIGFGKAAAKAGPPPEIVGSTVSKAETWEATISAVGSVEAGKGVAITNDAPGVVKAIHFESGARVKQGQVLVELDTSVERAQIAAALVRQDLAKTTEGRTRTLVSASAVAGAELDTDVASLRSASADVATLQAQLARKIVRAPFTGKLGIRTVNLGQYLNPGTSLAVLQSTDDEYVDFTLPQQRLSDVQVGTVVRVVVNGNTPGALVGAISAIEPSVDAVTRSVHLRATAKDSDKKLRPGMFVNVVVVLPTEHKVIAVPVTSVVHASYGDSVFVIEEQPADGDKPARTIARQQFVRSGETRGDFVAIEDGLKGGETLVTAGAFKLRNGSGVSVDNNVGAKPEKSPHPDDR